MTQLRSRRPLAVVVLAVVALATAACGGDDVSSERRSEPRPESGTSAYCDRVAELTRTDLGEDPDPTAVIELLETLAPLAPASLGESFEVLAGALEDLSDLDQDDPADIERLLEVALAPEVVEASEAITSYTDAECGVDLEGAVNERMQGGDLTGDLGDVDDFDDLDDVGGDPGSDSDGVTLEDIEAITDATDATWAAKATGTVVSGGADVQVVAMETEPFTADEALAACEALLSGLVERHPDVSIKVLNAETVAAAADAGGSCAAA
jgi:hypothetical protein